MKTRIQKYYLILLMIFLIFQPTDTNLEPKIKISSATNMISFSGYEWNVKSSQGQLWGPGPNYFNDSSQNVWVDSNGSLHLRVSYEICADRWYCAEIYSVESFGYGTYEFILEPGFENLDKNVVLGLFTYLDDNNEIDIEYAKWGQDTSDNGQYVLQPSWKPNHIKRYKFNPQGESSIHKFSWCKNTIDFKSYTISENKEKSWRYYGPGIPLPSTEHVHLNLWLMQGLAPSDHTECEVVITSFEYTPSRCEYSIIGFWWLFSISLISALGILATVLIIVVRKKHGIKK